uniref:phosphatidate phosphatase n=1 Tax=Strix occidentalis caurina TaxID=311401 RepID=A0A8D0EQ80_STROC
MNYVGQLAETVFVTVKELYRGLNPATLTGCIDVVVVRQPDNSFQCSPFHVRFGKLGVLRSKEKVVDIEINGEPVDLHMKLGDNGEAFFVQESEENEVGDEEVLIPSCLCTSPIPREESLQDVAQPSHGQEASSAEATPRKRRRRRRKPKRKEVSDSELEGCEETKSEMSVEEPCKLVDEVCVPFSSCSPTLGHPSSPKSDSELEIRPQESFALGAESHMQWSWGRLPQVSPCSCSPLAAGGRGMSERSAESRGSCGQTITTAATTVSVTPVPVDEATHLVATSKGLGEGPSPAGPQSVSCSSAVSVVEPTPTPQGENRSIKRSSHLGPSDVYLEDLSNLDEEQVALYFPRSSKPVADPSNPLCVQLPSDLPADSPTDSDSDLMPTIALSLCGGLGGSRQISHEKFMEHMVSYQQFAENPGLIDDSNLVILINKKYYNWAVAAPMILSLQAFQRNIPESTIDQLVKEKMPKKGRRWWFSWRRREFPAEEGTGAILVAGRVGVGEQQGPGDGLRMRTGRLNLQDGPNEVAFSVTTQYQGTCRCEATIYLWNWDDKVVISDIDGTITKSDALGHILPHLGKDWTHHGIAKLFHKIHLNGYRFLYCSARAIGMAHITKGYLKWVNEQGCALPKGPILLAPSSLFSAFHREVIEKKPEVFKIACLMDIQKLFAMKLPFYAAFGNRASDVYAYKQVGLPESRIFTVNPKGELIQELTKNHKSTYERLSELVELIFPPLGQSGSIALVCPEYSHFAYWRPPLPAVDLDAFS